MPFRDQSYRTIIYATGVIDFMGNEPTIRQIMQEGRRVAHPSGKIFVAFYRFSDALAQFLELVGLLKEGILDQKGSLETDLLSPPEMVRWILGRTNSGTARALSLFLKTAIRRSMREKINASRMQKLFRNRDTATRLIERAPQTQPYRDKVEIEALVARLAVPVKQIRMLHSCFTVEI